MNEVLARGPYTLLSKLLTYRRDGCWRQEVSLKPGSGLCRGPAWEMRVCLVIQPGNHCVFRINMGQAKIRERLVFISEMCLNEVPHARWLKAGLAVL